MAIRKLKNQQTDARLLLESDDPVELPRAEVEESAVVVQFDSVRPYVPELLDTLRAGTVAELVPVMMDGSTFAVHTATRTFWVKIWHASPERTRVHRVQVLSCLPSTRGVQVIVADDYEGDDDYDEDGDYEDEDNDGDDYDGADDERDTFPPESGEVPDEKN